MIWVLDTHVLLWWLGGSDRLPKEHGKLLSGVSAEEPAVVSDISLWEIATLQRLGKITLDLPLRDWLESAVAPPLVRRFGITTAVAAASAEFSDEFPGDPADRLIAATARVLGGILLTADRRIIGSGEVEVA